MIKLQNGNEWMLNHVRHTPNLRRNLILSRQLDDEGCTTNLTKKFWKVTKGSLALAKGENLFVVFIY